MGKKLLFTPVGTAYGSASDTSSYIKILKTVLINLDNL